MLVKTVIRILVLNVPLDSTLIPSRVMYKVQNHLKQMVESAHLKVFPLHGKLFLTSCVVSILILLKLTTTQRLTKTPNS
jgi:hypothetical protein